MTAKVFDLLLALIRNRDRVVTRDDALEYGIELDHARELQRGYELEPIPDGARGF